MKKLYYLLLLAFIVAMSFSCSDSDEESKKVTIPEGWTENDDIAKLGKVDWFLHRSATDSIYISFIDLRFERGSGVIFLRHYTKHSGGYKFKTSVSISAVHTIERANKTKIIGYYDEKYDCELDYKIIDDKTLHIYNFPDMDELSEGLEFDAVVEKETNEKNLLLGGWYNTQVVDSTVIAFEDDAIKEYLFVRGGEIIQDSWNYGGYRATLTQHYLGEELIRRERELSFKDIYGEDCSYSINGDKLTIYWNSPRNTMTYTRIK